MAVNHEAGGELDAVRAHMMQRLSRRAFGTLGSPAATVLAATHGIDLASILPTGPKGHVTKGDVLAALKSGTSSSSQKSNSIE